MKIVKAVILIISVFFIGCNTTTLPEGEDEMNKALLEEVEREKEPFISKEDFLQKVARNEGVLGVNVDDFKDIDVDHFIESRRIKASTMEWYISGNGDLKDRLELYIYKLLIEEVRSYAATEIVIAESTDEEYREFIEEYLKTIKEEVEVVNNNQRTYFERDYGFDRYRIKDDIGTEFYIVRTTDIEMLKEMRWRFIVNNLCGVEIPHNNMHSGSLLYFSKSNKYFMGFVVEPRTVDIVKNFCEMDD